MADKKISELTAIGTTPANDDVLPLVDTNVTTTKKVTYSNLGVPANTTHRGSDGKNHSDVVLNNAHRTEQETEQTLTDQATITWDMESGVHAKVTLAGNRTMGAPTNLAVGYCTLHVIQDGSGSRTLDFSNAIFKFPGGSEPVMSTGAGDIDVLSFYCDGTTLFGIANYDFS